ncbi:hypothetical protein [Epilithonimonas mollis]|uniref:Uncharacterized protein n=1 Tax=Epilithonimonas mollis TaxID=216903 RepID=A0A1M6TAZ0_9FLAO|nr:hypothetical protein [Epilithonimonas mollis]SHK54034.1 hypothetical protein SAMN05444371_2754 [Epilithonimonas mollis]
MKKLYNILFLFFLTTGISAQNLEKIAQEITDEGIMLYRSEMASWYGTDIFLANYKNRENIGGYFSYIDDGIPKCIFFSKSKRVIGTIAFPTNYKPENANIDLSERDFTSTENEYATIRHAALERVKKDTIFKYYNNTDFNLIPIIKKDVRKVYVLTGPKQNNIVLFGNDYLIDFNKKNEIKKVQRLHKSLITQKITDEKVGKTVSGIHSHILEDWPYMTPTDICTLMLYQNLTNWESYNVVNKKYLSIWNNKTNQLVIMLTDVVRKINDDQKNGHPENQNPDNNNIEK